MSSIADLLMDLGVAGMELSPHPTDPSRIRHRPAKLPADLAARLQADKPAILALLVGGELPDEDAAYRRDERLGAAELLDLPTHVGSPSWLIATAEAMGALPKRNVVGGRATPEALAALVSSVLGVGMYAEVIPAGHRFDGEPDWNNIPLAANRTPQQGTAPCRMCHRQRWWRIEGEGGVPTCGACHPPVPGLDVVWLGGAA
ncbi:MAG: hypothetical protein IT438_11840 [Phycisphaerales bacterium]|nr:hypothetical protein [Phycisphaerales bacterium]